jgi:mevalonate pyrophosphate decarboxylase
MTTSLSLANVVHVQEDPSNEELRLVVAGIMNKSSKYSSRKMMRIHLRFEHKNEYFVWFHHLTNAIQQAKDQSWTKKNELVI